MTSNIFGAFPFRRLGKRIAAALDIKLLNVHPDRVRGIDLEADLLHVTNGKPGLVCFDVGANIGQTTQLFLRIFDRPIVIAFEPCAESCALLKGTYANNGRVMVENLALGDKEEQRRFFLYGGSSTSPLNSFLVLSEDGDNFLRDQVLREQRLLEVSTLTKYCKEKGFLRIDLLKIDTQGYDLKVLEGGSDLLDDGRIENVLLEVQWLPTYEEQPEFAEIHRYLVQLGLRLVGFYDQHFAGKAMAYCNALYSKCGGNRPDVRWDSEKRNRISTMCYSMIGAGPECT